MRACREPARPATVCALRTGLASSPGRTLRGAEKRGPRSSPRHCRPAPCAAGTSPGRARRGPAPPRRRRP
eukprot:10235167-Lingulodinium_polyedra.AAC.1